MSYFSRPRAYSKPTKEEAKELGYHLARVSPHELHLICQMAASESSEVAKILMKVMVNAKLVAQPVFKTVQEEHEHVNFGGSIRHEHGLPTPNESCEDSEMSGIEDPQSEMSETLERGARGAQGLQPIMPLSHLSNRPSNKRKSLADRDDKPPTLSPRTNRSKKLRNTSRDLAINCEASNHTSHEAHWRNKHSCRNCGHFVESHQWDNLHGCMYHPGSRQSKQWSCCLSDMNVPGCVITRHQELDVS